MDYTNPIDVSSIEQNILERLQIVLAADITAGNIEVELLPDQPVNFNRPTKKTGRISVVYMGAESTDKIKSLSGTVIQDVFNLFGFFLCSKTRLGVGGVNDLYTKTLQALLGYPPLNHERMFFQKNTLFMRETDTALWFQRLEMKAKTVITQWDGDAIAPGRIVQITHEPSDAMPSGFPTIVVDENTPIGPNPL